MKSPEEIERRLKKLEMQVDDHYWQNLFLKNDIIRLLSDKDTFYETMFGFIDINSNKSIRFVNIFDMRWFHFGDALNFIGKNRAYAASYIKKFGEYGFNKFLVKPDKGGLIWTYFVSITKLYAVTEQNEMDFSKLLCMFDKYGTKCKMKIYIPEGQGISSFYFVSRSRGWNSYDISTN